jgi:hypothetical protein
MTKVMCENCIKEREKIKKSLKEFIHDYAENEYRVIFENKTEYLLNSQDAKDFGNVTVFINWFEEHFKEWLNDV